MSTGLEMAIRGKSMMHGCRRCRLQLIAGSVVVSLLLLAGCQAPPQELQELNEAVNMAQPIAQTVHGPVRGVIESGILTFRGVRYGRDTSTTRFAAPQPPKPWQQAASAERFGDTCPQTSTGNPGGLFTSWQPEPVPGMSEDCLFLNIWTPALNDAGKRPVMVWFHGGGFATGSGSSRAYDGARLASRGDVVVITVNHRLNVLGYLALSHYGQGFEDSAVAGVLDMVLALEWVADNAAAFGGDPNNVMVFGESGGGAKVSTLLTTPKARGLFHRAVVQSGAMIRFPDAGRAQYAADRVLENLGLDRNSVSRIKTLPESEIRAAFAGTGAATAPTIDGKTLTRHPFYPDAAPSGRDVPLMLGTTRTENSLFIGAVNPDVFTMTWDELPGALERALPNHDSQKIIAGYKKINANADAVDILFEATSDARWLAGHRVQAQRKVQQGGAPVWLYLFDWDTPVDGGKWRSPHALDIGFVFDNVRYSESMSGSGPEQQRVADIMADTWIAFARNGNPNNPNLPTWRPYNLNTQPVMVFSETPRQVNDARGAQLQLVDDSESYGNRYQR